MRWGKPCKYYDVENPHAPHSKTSPYVPKLAVLAKFRLEFVRKNFAERQSRRSPSHCTLTESDVRCRRTQGQSAANLLLTLPCYLVILAPTSLGYNYAGAIPMGTKLITAVGTGLFWVLCYGASAWMLSLCALRRSALCVLCVQSSELHLPFVLRAKSSAMLEPANGPRPWDRPGVLLYSPQASRAATATRKSAAFTPRGG